MVYGGGHVARGRPLRCPSSRCCSILYGAKHSESSRVSWSVDDGGCGDADYRQGAERHRDPVPLGCDSRCTLLSGKRRGCRLLDVDDNVEHGWEGGIGVKGAGDDTIFDIGTIPQHLERA